jgi:hypothetical protein
MDEGWGDAAEAEFAARVGKRFCAAQLRTKPGGPTKRLHGPCSSCSYGSPLPRAGCETSDCNAVVEHIGDQRTPGWTPEVGYGAAPQTDCVPRACKESLGASAPCREIHRWLARQVEYLPGGRFQCSSYGKRLGEDACRAALGVSRENPRA